MPAQTQSPPPRPPTEKPNHHPSPAARTTGPCPPASPGPTHATHHRSLSTQLYLWDCCYLALALESDCPFVTADRRLARGGNPRHPSITLLA